MNNQKVLDGYTFDYTNNTGVDLKAGDPVMVGKKLCVCAVDIANTASGTVVNEGVFTLNKDTNAGSGGAQGADAYWDPTPKKVTANTTDGLSPPTNLVRIGCFYTTAQDADATADIKLSEY